MTKQNEIAIPLLPKKSIKDMGRETALDTADWKTYRNEEYGFEFRYPKDYTIDKSNVKSINISRDIEPKGDDYLVFRRNGGNFI
jgi:hypothetical protein